MGIPLFTIPSADENYTRLKPELRTFAIQNMGIKCLCQSLWLGASQLCISEINLGKLHVVKR